MLKTRYVSITSVVIAMFLFSFIGISDAIEITELGPQMVLMKLLSNITCI